MRRKIRVRVRAGIAALAIACGAGGMARAQSFSAGLAIVTAGGAAGGEGTVQVGGGKVRIETPEVPRGFLLVDPQAGAAYLVRPTGHFFVDAGRRSRWTQLLVPVDPARPCVAWQAMVKVAQDGAWRCVRLGERTLNGRETVLYQMTSPAGQVLQGWVDTALKFLVRLRDGDGAGMDLVKVEEGPQPAGMFAIPSGFLKLDPQRMLESVKHSDVYVPPPGEATGVGQVSVK